jgi:formate/nitrite transporter FocA (FNT family)
MKMPLLFLGLLCALGGASLFTRPVMYAIAQWPAERIAGGAIALSLFLIAAVLLVGAAIVDAIQGLQSADTTAEKPKPKTFNEWMKT